MKRGIFKDNLILSYCFAPIRDVQLSDTAEAQRELRAKTAAHAQTHAHTERQTLTHSDESDLTV